jgi:hypothetical protein
MSELEEVKRKIASVEARLERAKEQGLPIDNPGVVALRNELTALYGEKASLRSSTSGQFFEIGLMHLCKYYTHHGIICFCLFIYLFIYLLPSLLSPILQ